MSKAVLIGLIGVVVMLGLLPFALIARSRATKSENTAPHLVLDMDKQPRLNPQAPSPMFADGRAMRPQIAGTVAREDLVARNEILNDVEKPRLVDDSANVQTIDSPEKYAALVLGRVRPAGMTDEQFGAMVPPAKPDDQEQMFYVKTIPAQIAVTMDFLKRGQERFIIYCSPCHGQSGYGDGMVARRAKGLQDAGSDAASGWVTPKNYHDDEMRQRPDGHIFNTITNGIRTMPPYDKQITVMDRWAIVAYVRALQRSQDAQLEDLPAADREKYK